MHLPVDSSWFYVATERGNIYPVHAESLGRCGYDIMWNHVTNKYARRHPVCSTHYQRGELQHPGAIVGLAENPNDANKVTTTLNSLINKDDVMQLLVAYELGMMILWDLKAKTVDKRFNTTQQPVISLCNANSLNAQCCRKYTAWCGAATERHSSAAIMMAQSHDGTPAWRPLRKR